MGKRRRVIDSSLFETEKMVLFSIESCELSPVQCVQQFDQLDMALQKYHARLLQQDNGLFLAYPDEKEIPEEVFELVRIYGFSFSET